MVMTAHDDLREAVARAISPTLYGGAEYKLTRADLRRADAALAAVRAALREPSAEMLDAFIDKALKADDFSYGLKIDSPRKGYAAMLAASPLADPAARDDGEGVG